MDEKDLNEVKEILDNIDQEVGIISQIGGQTEDGQDFWAYISIPPSKYPAFEKAQENGEAFNILEFADVLKHGQGTQPPADIVEEMVRDYGIDPEFDQKLEQTRKNFEDRKK